MLLVVVLGLRWGALGLLDFLRVYLHSHKTGSCFGGSGEYLSKPNDVKGYSFVSSFSSVAQP